MYKRQELETKICSHNNGGKQGRQSSEEHTHETDTPRSLEDADWENNWKQYYKPMEIGERLLVVPIPRQSGSVAAR